MEQLTIPWWAWCFLAIAAIALAWLTVEVVVMAVQSWRANHEWDKLAHSRDPYICATIEREEIKVIHGPVRPFNYEED